MKNRIVTAALGICLLVGCAPAAITLAEKGTARAVIVVAADASEPERHAAAELAEFLGIVAGAKFEVAAECRDDRTPRLLVGPGAARLADPAFTTEGLGKEGLVIRSTDRDLILAGGRPRGTLYAVYAFLEDVVGCRWWSSRAATIPRIPDLAVAPLNVRYVPPLEYREPYWTDAFDGDWAVRNKCNSHAARLDARRGGKHVYEGYVHTFFPLIPPEKYFKDHPDWFSEIKGKRTADRAQLCLTNEEMRRELVRNLSDRLRRNPRATIASVSQNDWRNPCTCKACAAIDEEEGSHSGTLLRFVNAVAADIEKEFPRVSVSTLAYQYTRTPPKLVRPRANVIVQLCSIECSFSRPLTDERNAAFRRDIEGWSKVCDRLYIWDYTTNFWNYVLPHPNLRVLGPNVKFFAEHGAKGVFEQGAYDTRGAEMAELRAWVLAKLLWNPALDAQKLIDEFLDGYFGPAGRHVRAYLDVVHDAAEAEGEYLRCFTPPTAKFLSFPTLASGWAHLAAAEAAVKDDPDRLQRVRVAQLPVMFAFLMRWEEFHKAAEAAKAPWPMEESIEEVHQRFMNGAKAAGITRIREGIAGFEALDKVVQKVREKQKPKGDKPATAPGR